MEPVLGIALIAGLMLISLLAARRVARGQGRFVWIYMAPMAVMMIFLLWIAVRISMTQPVLAIGLALFIVPTLILFVRMAKRMAADVGAGNIIGELSAPHFDYIVWMALGAPFLLVALLLVLLITGGLGTTR